MLSVARTAIYLLPSFRRTGVGVALSLERPARPGAVGAASDFLGCLMGACRGMPAQAGSRAGSRRGGDAGQAAGGACACLRQPWPRCAAPLAGIRVLSILMVCVFAPAPPAMTLVTHVALSALVMNAGGYCATHLLADQLFRRRLATVAAALEYAVIPLTALLPAANLLSSSGIAEGEQQGEACSARD